MKLKALVLLPLALTLIACEQKMEEKPPEAPAPTTLDTDADRFSYGLGMIIGERVLKQYGDVDYDLLIEGMKAQHKDESTLITIDDAGAALQAHMEKEFTAKADAAKAKGVALPD